jgi:hypothetical protein
MARRGAEENGKALRRREAKTASLTTKTKPTSDGALKLWRVLSSINPVYGQLILGVTQSCASVVGLAIPQVHPQGEKNEEAYSRRRANRRVCYSGFGPDFRSLLCGSRYDDPYMLGGDENGPRHENDGKI